MSTDDDWGSILADHPIFSLPESDKFDGSASLQLSTLDAPKSSDKDGSTGRRQTMLVKDTDLIVAFGKQIRMASLSDIKHGRPVRKSYKTLNIPEIQFDIHQISLNPNGKLLAVAGTYQLVVVVLPRAGFARLASEIVDCKSVQLGKFYHSAKNSVPIAKIDWHPWGEAGSTLMIMTIDGKMREYDVSVDPDEPQQTLSFVSDKKSRSFAAEDESEGHVTSFTLGKGRGDWGPLTIYAVMKSGDVFAICPYMPVNAIIPSAYIHSLECFVSAKQEYLSTPSSSSSPTSTDTKKLTSLYDHQHKYISALVKQLPPGTIFPAASRGVSMHPPSTIKTKPLRQGPFLLQPAPRHIEGSEGGYATDVAYLAFGDEHGANDEGEGETDSLGVLMIAFQDGKVDVCLDVEKVEARWETKQATSSELPMLAVYESIDLGLVSTLRGVDAHSGETSALELLQSNHPTLLADPIHDDTIYVYHAFGVHALDIGPLLRTFSDALRKEDDDDALTDALNNKTGTSVYPILSTFSVQRRSSSPVVGVTIPNDIYLTYSIFMLTSTLRITAFSLNFHSDSSPPQSPPPTAELSDEKRWLTPLPGPPPYVSLLGTTPFVPPPVLSAPSSGLPSNPRLSFGPGDPKSKAKEEFMLTPDTLRFIGATVGKLSAQIRDSQLAYNTVVARASLQSNEAQRQRDKVAEMQALVDTMRKRQDTWKTRVEGVNGRMRGLMDRLDSVLKAMVDKASPDLSEAERGWFEELRSMKEDIVGRAKWDGDSLVSRSATLEKEYERLMPNLRSLTEKELAMQKKTADYPPSLGASQASEYGERSNSQGARITQLEQSIKDITSRLEASMVNISAES